MTRKKTQSPEKIEIFFLAVGLLGVLAFFSLKGPILHPEPARVAVRPAPAIRRPVPKVPAPAVPAPVAPLPVIPKGKGKIAIVLDDWGYTLKNVPALSAIRGPVTVAVLPNLPHSAAVARAAHAHGHEVILHMPMQAMDPQAPREEGTLLTGMPRAQVLELLDRALATVPAAEGISNHQGSRATADPALMEVVLREARRRRLYFLDSFVTSQSVCDEVAGRVKVRFARRAVFLDNEETAPAIRRRLAELAEAARDQGRAIGIGHDRPETLEALGESIRELKKAGYTLVPVSDLVQ